MTARIVISSGEPAGIGPDITLQALLQEYDAEIAVVGCPKLFNHRAHTLGLSFQINKLSGSSPIPNHRPGIVNLISTETRQPVAAGELNTGNSQYVIDCINQATDGCLDDKFDAVVTAPVHKGIINDAGIAFSGHTEWIANRCGGFSPVMMLADTNLRVCLATTHLPLSAVSESITKDSLRKVLQVMHTDLSRLYDISAPRIAVCGLNPHAGEGGHLGTEEIDTIEPTIKELQQQGLNLLGPVPADTIFTQNNLKNFDAVLAMYHDQGLPVVKHSGFGEVVNVTLGIPVIRTSVDHGTALDLAGTGQASENSLIAAINLAIQFAHNRTPV